MSTIDYNVGRAKHLGQIALIFKHRHGTWADFGQFLKVLFGEVVQPAGNSFDVPQRQLCGCRHASGERHGIVLDQVKLRPNDYPVFDHPRYTRPCFGIGAWEVDKNPGLVVGDVCKKAGAFLTSIGRGDPDEATGRDFEFRVEEEDAISLSGLWDTVGVSQVSDPMSDIDLGNIVDAPRQRNAPGSLDNPSDNEYGDSFFEDEDVLEVLEGQLREVDALGGSQGSSLGKTIETPPGYAGSDDSVLQSTTRSTTKLRAHMLAYLWNFADDPGGLRREFRRLRLDDKLCVLHLCGCGICYTKSGAGTIREWGCSEKTHLVLGYRDLNDLHKSYHVVLGLAPSDNYITLVGAIRGNGVTGEGVF